MPDYSTIIKRSVESVPDHTPEMRRAIYDRARATIAKQLANVDPPLSAEQIEKQQGQLEQAIAEVEAEFSFEGFDPAEFEAEIGLQVREQISDAEDEPLDEPDHAIHDEIDEPERRIPEPAPAVKHTPPSELIAFSCCSFGVLFIAALAYKLAENGKRYRHHYPKEEPGIRYPF